MTLFSKKAQLIGLVCFILFIVIGITFSYGVQYSTLVVRPGNPVSPVGTWIGTGTRVKTQVFYSVNESSEDITRATAQINQIQGTSNVYDVSLTYVLSGGSSHDYAFYGVFADNRLYINRSMVLGDETSGYQTVKSWGTLSFQSYVNSANTVEIIHNESNHFMGMKSPTGAIAEIYSTTCAKQ